MIDWIKIWNDLEEWVVQDMNEGIPMTKSRYQNYIMLLVNKQLRRQK